MDIPMGVGVCHRQARGGQEQTAATTHATVQGGAETAKTPSYIVLDSINEVLNSFQTSGLASLDY